MKLSGYHQPLSLHFQGTFIQRNSSNLSDDEGSYLIRQLMDGPLDRKGVTYAIDARPDGDIIMIFDRNKTQKTAIDNALRSRGIHTRFRYTRDTLTPTNDVSQKANILKANRAMELWEEAIADKERIDVEKLVQAMALLKQIPGFILMGIKTDSGTGEIKAENVLDWLRGADPEVALRQLRARWN